MYEFSLHSVEQISKRNITQETVLWIIESAATKMTEDDLAIFQNIIIEDEKEYLIRVFVNEDKTPALIVTAYKTSNIKKYRK